MLKNILKREKSRVYLGTLAVVPRTGIKQNFDSFSFTEIIELDNTLKERLVEIFCLPSSSSRSESLESDLIIDVFISEFQLGEAFLTDILIPVFWRPKITLVAKLRYLNSGKTKKVLSVTEKMPLGEFVRRFFTLQGILQFRPAFNSDDLERLLYIACGKVLAKMKKSI